MRGIHRGAEVKRHEAPIERPVAGLTLPLLLAAATPAFPETAKARGVATDRQDFLERFARAYFPGRTGQLVVVPREGHIITKRGPAQHFMHGSPWPYDSRIPFLLLRAPLRPTRYLPRAGRPAGHGPDPGRAARSGDARDERRSEPEHDSQGPDRTATLDSAGRPGRNAPGLFRPSRGRASYARSPAPGRGVVQQCAVELPADDHQPRPRDGRYRRRPPSPRNRRQRLLRLGSRPAG